MVKWIYNTSGVTKNYHNTDILNGTFHQIPENLLAEYQSSAQLISDLALGVVKMSSDGVAAITGDGSDHVNFLKGMAIEPRDSDGSPLHRIKITTTGWSYQRHCFEIETSKLNSLYSKRYDDSDFNFLTLKFYNSQNTELTTQQDIDLECVKTVIDWEPTHDYEVLGGEVRQKTVPTEDVRAWIVAVPDIPSANGGTKEFVCGANLAFLGTEQSLKTDGRAPKYLSYNAQLHTNKIRAILRHPAGFKHKLHILFEIFKP